MQQQFERGYVKNGYVKNVYVHHGEIGLCAYMHVSEHKKKHVCVCLYI